MFSQTMIIGNLGSDVDSRITPSGKQVASFSLAENRRNDKTVWWRVTVWEKNAELCERYLAKGRKVMVLGEVEQPQVFTGRDGEPRASLEITARVVKFLDSREQYDTTMHLDVSVEGADSLPF